MMLGSSASGNRAMTSSSGPGISLMQEGISYLAGTELPAVIVNISRCGPGLGGISASQGDYFQATRGGGHGDYRTIVLAPHSVQEMHDLAMLAFDLADLYRNPGWSSARQCGPGADAGNHEEGQPLSSPSRLPQRKMDPDRTSNYEQSRTWSSLSILKRRGMEKHNWKLFEKYKSMKKETRCELFRAGR